MNILFVATLGTIVFFIGKMALTYKNPNVKACIQDSVLAYASSFIGLYGYEKYGNLKTTAKPTEVFTEKPNF
jgi:hypothetical protein